MNESAILIVGGAFLILILAIGPVSTLIRARTTCYDFRDGYLYATAGGVAFRKETSYQLVHLLGTTIARGPLDFLTGNGSLHLDFGHAHGKVKLRGLAPIAELKVIRDDLNNFAQLLKTYPEIKGLIL